MFLYLLGALLVLLVVLPLAGVALWLVINTVVTGLIIGALGRLVVPGPQRIGLLPTVVVGVGGSLFGTFLGALLHTGGLVTLLLQIAAAAALVALYAGRDRRTVGGAGWGQVSGRRY
jgi:uncharacterized membrane protein YeaQ/YmgE (transglycosylase-associated protein family)